MEAIKRWFRSNSLMSRLTRTIAQGIIGVLIANIDFLIESLKFSGPTKAFIVALCMAVLSPIMKELGGGEPDGDK